MAQTEGRVTALLGGGGVTILTISIAWPLCRPRSGRTCLLLLLALMSHTGRRMTSRLQVQLALLSLLCRCLLLLLMSMAALCLPAQTERLVTGSAALPVGLQPSLGRQVWLARLTLSRRHPLLQRRAVHSTPQALH